MRKLALDASGNLLHRLDLRGGADARYRQADIHGRSDALIEEIGLEEDLAVGDRDDIGRDIGGDIIGLRLDHRQRGERACAICVIELGGAFEQARMQVEHIARIGFAAGRPAKQQRHLAIGDGLFGKVIIGDHRMHTIVAEEFAHRAARKWCQILHGRGIGRCGRDDDRIIERAIVFERLDELGDGRALLAAGDIDAIELFLLRPHNMDRPLIENGVENDRSLAGLPIADDELALAAADRDQSIDSLEAGRHRFVHRLSRNDAGRLDVDAAALGCADRTLTVDGIAERINHAAKQFLADRHFDDRAGAPDDVALLDVAVGAEDHHTDIVDFEIERHAADAAWEFDHLAGLDVVEPVDAGNAIANRQHLTDFGDFGLLAEILDLGLQDGGDFGGAEIHLRNSLHGDAQVLQFGFKRVVNHA